MKAFLGAIYIQYGGSAAPPEYVLIEASNEEQAKTLLESEAKELVKEYKKKTPHFVSLVRCEVKKTITAK